MIVDIIPVTNTPPGRSFFSYLLPGDIKEPITPGQLVSIVFRGKRIHGIVLGENASNDVPTAKLKPIEKIITDFSLIPPSTLKLIVELANVHSASLGQLLKSTLPALGPRSIKKILSLTVPPTSKVTSQTKAEYETVKNKEEYVKKIITSSKLGLQQLILAPEIQILNELQKELEKKIKIFTLHGTTKPKEYSDLWLRLRQGEPCLVLGTRAALFLPWTNLSHILVTEEGNKSYKSFDAAPRYQTEVVAERLASLTGANLTFLAHSPSVVRVQKFADIPPLPGTHIVNMKEERAHGNSSIISRELEAKLQSVPGNALLLLNRLGGVTTVSCRDCDFIWHCKNCSRSMVLYQKAGELRCNYCNIRQKFFAVCPNCHGSNLKLFGAGTESLEKAILNREWSKNYTVLRLDNTTTLKKLPTSSKPLLIIGTEFAFRFIAFSELSLAAILDPDATLYIPEYNAIESTWQKLRSLKFWLNKNVPLYIQTRHPEHTTIQGLAVPKLFYEAELPARKLFKYPPFFTVLKIFKSGDNAILTTEGVALYKQLSALTKELKLAILEPPRPAFPPVLNGQFRLILLAKIEGIPTAEETEAIINKIPPTWKIDWNPESLLSI